MLPVLMMGKSFRKERGTGVGAEARQMPQKGGEKWGSDKGTLLSWAQDQHVLGAVGLSREAAAPELGGEGRLRWLWGWHSDHRVWGSVKFVTLGQVECGHQPGLTLMIQALPQNPPPPTEALTAVVAAGHGSGLGLAGSGSGAHCVSLSERLELE